MFVCMYIHTYTYTYIYYFKINQAKETEEISVNFKVEPKVQNMKSNFTDNVGHK